VCAGVTTKGRNVLIAPRSAPDFEDDRINEHPGAYRGVFFDWIDQGISTQQFQQFLGYLPGTVTERA
jgi:hypothetical protein